MLIEEVGGGLELYGREVVVEGEDAVANHAAAGDDDRQNSALRQAAEVDVLEQVGGRRCADGEADAAGECGEDVRGALEEGGGSGDAGEAGVDVGLQVSARRIKRRDGRVGELADVEAEGFRRGDAAGGGVRLLEQAGVGEFGHLVADGGGAHGVGEGRLREGARADGLPGRDVALDDGGEDLALAGCDGAGH